MDIYNIYGRYICVKFNKPNYNGQDKEMTHKYTTRIFKPQFELMTV